MRVAIIEDEPVVARRLERQVRSVLGDTLERISVATTFEDAVVLLRHTADCTVLLDLDLDGSDGFDLLRRTLAEPFQVIVVSANTDRAVQAFHMGVVDFVPKPCTEERLRKALGRARREGGPGGPAPACLAVTLAGHVDLVPLDSIVAVHGADDFSELETVDGQRHLHRKTLTALEQCLPAGFARVHRSHIVNLRFLTAVRFEPSGSRVAELSNGSVVRVSRTYGGQFSIDRMR